MKEENKISTKKRFKLANIIFWVVLAIVAIYSVVALTTTNDSVTSIFGRTAFTVQTNSMAPTFEAGDLIFVETDFEASDIKVGDVITYRALIDINGDGQAESILNSHRVVAIEIDNNNNLHFVTKGDNNSQNDDGTVHQANIIALWTGDSISNLGKIIDNTLGFLKSGTGFFIFIVLPCFAFLVYEVIKFVNVMSEYKAEQALESRDKIREEALALARKQLEEEAKLKEQEEAKTE